MRVPLLLAAGALLSSCSVLGSRPQDGQEIDWFQSDYYAGVTFGQSQFDVSASDIDRALADLGYATDTDLDDTDLAFQAYVGYRFDGPFAVELGYVNLGQIESTIEATPTNNDLFLDDVADVHPVLGRGAQLQARWFAWANERVEVSVGAGVWFWEGDMEAAAGTGERVEISRDGIDPTVGIAATIGLKGRWDLRAAWDRYYLDDEAADAFLIGLQVGLY